MKDLGTGLCTNVNPFEVPLGGCTECSNLVWVDGYLRARPGLSEAYNTFSALRVHHIKRFLGSDLTNRLMRLDYSAGNVYLNAWNGAWSAIGGALPGGSLTYPPTSDGWLGYYWFTTGDGDVYRYDPAGPSLVTVRSLQVDYPTKAIPDAPRILVAGDSRLFVANCLDSNDGTNSGTRIPGRVAWSDFRIGYTWLGGTNGGSSRYIDFENEEVTGLHYSGSALMVFQPSNVWIGFSAGPPMIFDFRQRVPGVGCVSHQTIRRDRDGWVYWLGDDNVYRGGIDRSPEPIGDRIRNRIRQVCNLSLLSSSRAVLDRANRLYTLLVPDAVANKVCRTFTLNLANGSWWEGVINIPAIDITDSTEFRTDNWTQSLLLAGNTGKIYSMSLSNVTDDGTAITTEWKSGVLSTPDITQGETEQSGIQMLRVKAQSGQVTLGTYGGDNLDRMGTLNNFGTQLLDGTATIYTTERPKMAENHQIYLHGEASTMPKITQIAAGAILGSATR